VHDQATSRGTERCHHEIVIPDPKRLPGVETLSQYVAIRLFIERARTAKADAPELSPFFRRLAFSTHFGDLDSIRKLPS
jgi:hypothetical protein